MKQPFTHFDLSRQHLSERGHYIPPKARDEAEIARRKTLPKGTLIAEQQAKGVNIAYDILSNVEPGKDTAFTTRMLGMAAINTSWYIYGHDAPNVMRRRLFLPRMADPQTEWRQTPTELKDKTLSGLHTAYNLAVRVADDTAANKVSQRRVHSLGRQLGNMSLNLIVLGNGLSTTAGDAYDVQKDARDRALELLEDAKQFGIDHESHASIAQLANPDSTLGVLWRREAPNGALNAYHAAIEANAA